MQARAHVDLASHASDGLSHSLSTLPPPVKGNELSITAVSIRQGAELSPIVPHSNAITSFIPSQSYIFRSMGHFEKQHTQAVYIVHLKHKTQ